MKIIKILLLTMFSAAVVSSCSDENIEGKSGAAANQSSADTLHFEPSVPLTRIGFTGQRFVWNGGDRIRCVDKSASSRYMDYVIDEFYEGKSVAKAVRCSEYRYLEGNLYFVSPADYYKDKGADGNKWYVEYTTPAVYDYRTNNTAYDQLPMVAVAPNMNGNIVFYSTSALIDFRITRAPSQAARVNSVRIEALGGEQLSGTFRALFSRSTGAPDTIVGTADARSSITINCREGVNLPAGEYTHFYIAIPAGTYNGNLQLTVNATVDGVAKVIYYTLPSQSGGREFKKHCVYPATMSLKTFNVLPKLSNESMFGVYSQYNNKYINELEFWPNCTKTPSSSDGYAGATDDESIRIRAYVGYPYRLVLYTPAPKIEAETYTKGFFYPITTSTNPNVLSSLSKITGLQYLETSDVTSMVSFFRGLRWLTDFDLTGFDTRNVTSMRYMFSGCSSIVGADFSSFITDKVENMEDMFYQCSSLKSLDLSSFYTPALTKCDAMFYDCESLQSVNLSRFDGRSLQWVDNMFYGCKSLKSVDLSSVTSTPCLNVNASMFEGCDSIVSINLKHFTFPGTLSFSSMFAGCKNLKTLTIDSFYAPRLTSANSMFDGCENLTSIDLSTINSPNACEAQYMFRNCKRLTYLDLSGFEVKKGSYVTGIAENLASISGACTIKCSADVETSIRNNSTGAGTLTFIRP